MQKTLICFSFKIEKNIIIGILIDPNNKCLIVKWCDDMLKLSAKCWLEAITKNIPKIIKVKKHVSIYLSTVHHQSAMLDLSERVIFI